MKESIYRDFYLDSSDHAVCSLCDVDIPFDPGNIDSLIQSVDSHECADDANPEECPYTFAHTRAWCGNRNCRES